MTHTTNIRKTIKENELSLRNCYLCSLNFTAHSWTDDNWEIEFRTNHEPAWKTFFPKDDRGWVGFEIQLKHKECSKEIEFLEKEIEKGEKIISNLENKFYLTEEETKELGFIRTKLANLREARKLVDCSIAFFEKSEEKNAKMIKEIKNKYLKKATNEQK